MKTIIKIIIAIFLSLNIFIVGMLLYPMPQILKTLQPNDTIKIYDRNKQLLFEVPNQETGRQSFMKLETIPDNLKNAFLSIEDKNFYEHSGVDFSAILRSIWQNISAGEIVSGGSTITQQVVRNIVGINKQRTFTQKIKESILALKISKLFNKDKIFEVYLNSIYFGGLAYGVESASWQYFNKSAINLDLAESAFLAGLPQAPNRYFPFKNFNAATRRQQEVLSAMLNNNKINQENYNQALKEKIILQRTSSWNKKAPHFVDFVLQSIQQNLSELPKEIVTTLDYGMQERVEGIIQSNLTFLQRYNIENAAVIILDAKKGDILTMVGGKNYQDSSIDGAVNITTALRQPGSSIKPFVYAMALEKGWLANTIITDEPVSFKTAYGTTYSPQNFDLISHGDVTLAQALAQSLNIPAVKTMNYITTSAFLQFIKSFGITTLNKEPDHYGLSLALGSGEVKLLELINAYAIFANNGQDVKVHFMTNQNNQASQSQIIIKPIIAKTISAILSNNSLRMPAFGEENALKFSFPVAAKTGTTRNFRDNWTVGYTDDYVVGVWVGNASGQFMQGVSGITGAGPIFNKIMNMLHEMTGTKLTVDKSITLSALDTTVGTSRDLSLPQTPKTETFRIISPFSNDIFLFDPQKSASSQKIKLQASQKAQWYVDNQLVGTGESVLWAIKKGQHQIKAVYNTKERKVNIEVK